MKNRVRSSGWPGLSATVAGLLIASLAGATNPARTDSPFSWPDATPPHADISCATCHVLVAQNGTEPVEVQDLGVACRPCHDVTPGDTGSPNFFHRDADGQCVRCHSFHEAGTFTAMGRRHPVGVSEGSAWDHCRVCHRGGGSAVRVSDGHRAAADLLYHARHRELGTMSLSEGCMVCHSATSSSGPRLPQGLVSPRFNGHAGHRFGVKLVLGRRMGNGRIRDKVDERIALFEGRIECQTCHDITQSTTDYLMPFDPPYAMCETCHELHPGSSGRDRNHGDLAELHP